MRPAMTETTPDYAGLTPGERLIEGAREAVSTAKGEPSASPTIWHHMDGKTVAAYGPWVRHADFKEATRTLPESNAALERERDEQWKRADVLAQQNAYHKDRAETAEAQLAALTGPEGDMRDYHHGVVGSLMAERDRLAERVTELEDLCNSLEAQAMGLADDLKRAEDKLAEAMKVIGQIDNALNDQFAAGIEEREGGSARRQERLMKSGEELRRAARKFLKENGNGE